MAITTKNQKPQHPNHADGWAPSALILIVLCSAHFMDAIDLSDVTVALPNIGSDLHLGGSGLGWVVSAYLLGYGGFLLLGGRAADVLGRRRVLLTAVAIFAIGSLVATLAPNAGVLIGSRLVKGIAAGFLAPAALSLITTLWPDGERRGKALGAYALAGAGGFVGGLILGGLVTEISWRLAFLLPLPIAIAVFVLASRLIPRDTQRDSTRLDAGGAVLVTGAFSALVLGLTEAPVWGWTDWRTVSIAVAFIVLLLGFGWREFATPDPLLPLGLLRRRATAASSLSMALMWAAYTGFAFLATLGLQNDLSWSPIKTALAFVPLGVVNGGLATTFGRLAARRGARFLVASGMVVLTVSYVLFFRLDEGSSLVSVVMPIMLVNGLGIALCFAPLNVAALSDVPAERAGLAASLFNMSMQLGGALGLAAVTSVLSDHTDLVHFRAAIWTIIGLSSAGAAAALLLGGRGGPRSSWCS